MNILGVYRANGLGQLTPSRQQRTEASATITANLRARLQGLQGGVAKMATMQAKSSASTKSETLTGDQLDRDAFLQLLVEQIQNQDPLDPVSNEDMLAQLAQFSSLEQMNNLNETAESMQSQLDYLTGNVDQLNFLTAQTMIGQHVVGVDGDGNAVEGEVNSITLVGSIVVLNVDGEDVPMTNIVNVGYRPETSAETTEE